MDDEKDYNDRRLTHMYDTHEVLQRVHNVPRHVLKWMQDNHEGLWEAYNWFQEQFTMWPDIMDRGDFPTFCACMARMSGVDSTRTSVGRAGGRFFSRDYMSSKKNRAADLELWKKQATVPPNPHASVA